MDVTEAIKKRYSCRAYQNKPIEKEKMNKILEAARLAPSAKNLQDWRFVIVTEQETKNKLAHAANDQTFIAQAAAIIAACSNNDYIMSCGQPIGPIDVAIALEHIALEAAAMNLATCWIGSFIPDKVRRILNIPDNINVVELMAVGYPADSQRTPKRLPIENIACFEKWQF